MTFNKEFFKRWSTWANLASGVCAAVIVSIPALGLSAEKVGYVMLSMNVIVAVCQKVKQEAAK